MEEFLKSLAAALMEQLRPSIIQLIEERVEAAKAISIDDYEEDIETIIDRWVDLNPEKFSVDSQALKEAVETVLEDGSFSVEFSAGGRRW